MSQQITVNNCAGLYVQQNSFTVPDGALERALNIVCKQDQMAISRRGIAEQTSVVGTADGNALVEYLDRFFLSDGTAFNLIAADYTSKAALTDTSSLWSITKGTRPYFAKANGNLYATTANGPLKIESTSATIRKAGIPKGLDLAITTAITDGTSLFVVNSQVGYRILFGRLDANFNKVVGSPSEFATSTNSVNDNKAATAAVAVITVTSIAHGLTTGDLITTTDGKDSLGAAQTVMNRVDTAVTRLTDDTFTYNATAAPGGTPAYTVDWAVKKTINLNFTVPADALSTEFFYQIYRTDFTSSESVDPLEGTLQLIYEANLSSTEVSNKVVSFDDTVDDIFKGAFLYTNPNTGDGIVQANDPPPFCDDIVNFNDMVLYVNAKTKYRLSIGLVSTSNLSGNTFKVTSNAVTLTYTGAAAENIGAREFLVSSTGTTAQKITATVKSLLRVINRDASSDVVGYYVSTADGVPGKFVLESKRFDRNFAITVGSSTISSNFQPILPTSGSTVVGMNDDEPNAFYISKVKEPEAVPLLNKLFAGAKTSEILRAVPLRETCLLITESGVYGVRGSSPSSLTVQLIDNTVICKAKNSVAVINNECYFISNQGVAACSETGIRIVSTAIEPLFNSVLGNTYFEQFTKAYGYESDHLYILGTLAPNTTPTTMSETPTTASITSLIATLVFSSAVTSVVAGNSVVITGMGGTLTSLNGTFRVLSVSGSSITFYVNNANVASASSASATIKEISQNEIYVYNIRSNRWSQWDTYFEDALISSVTDSIVILKANAVVGTERKNFNNLDFADQSYSLTIGTVAADDLSTTATSSGTIEAGDAFVIDGTTYTVDSIDDDLVTYVFRSAVNFSNGATGTHYKSIEHELVMSPLTAGDVSRFKFFSEFQAVFRSASCRNVDVSFSSNNTSESQTITWESEILGGWGQLPFGFFPFGLGDSFNIVLTTQSNENVRVIVPATCSRATWIQSRLNHKRATEAFDLQSFSYRARAYGSRVGT